MQALSSLLLAIALSGACLSLTMFAVWRTDKRANYVLTMALGIILLVSHVLAYWVQGQYPSAMLAQLLLILLSAGFFAVYCSANQYLGLRGHHRAWPYLLTASLATALSLFAGYNGLAFMLGYGIATCLLVATGLAFWAGNERDKSVLAIVSGLGIVCAASFALCGAYLAWHGQWELPGGVPDNWTEGVNLVVSVSCMVVLGALTISLHYARTRNELVTESMTDPLTGLMNRRALTAIYGNISFGPNMAIAMFDLDDFKQTNDVFGHPVGDMVLQRFAHVIQKHGEPGMQCFRLGGEEFALVFGNVGAARARDIAEKIRVAFGAEVVNTPLGPLRCTVSAGLACGAPEGLSVEELLSNADGALYEAKRGGRNRTEAYVLYEAVGMAATLRIA